MTAHGGIEFGAARTGFQFQFSVEREDFEKIAMRSGGRTGTAVIAFTKVIDALDSGSRRTVLGDSCRFRMMFQTIQCVNKPRGASGSSTIKTSDFASFGTLLICNSGLTFVPLQVNFAGISPPA